MDNCLNPDNFAQEKLVEAKQKVLIDTGNGNGIESITLDGYCLAVCDSLAFRQFGKIWVLSVKGRMLTYGSYSHLIEVVALLIDTFECWQSDTSLIYFLNCEEYSSVVQAILNLRKIDLESETNKHN